MTYNLIIHIYFRSAESSDCHNNSGIQAMERATIVNLEGFEWKSSNLEMSHPFHSWLAGNSHMDLFYHEKVHKVESQKYPANSLSDVQGKPVEVLP